MSDPFYNSFTEGGWGSWTPAIAGASTAGTQTYSTQVGRYFKFFNICWVTARVTMTAKDAATAGNLTITGLPFTSENTTGISGSMSLGLVANLILDAGYSMFTGRVGLNQSFITLTEAGSNIASANLMAANLQATTDIAISGWYRTA
jgi:hypothetical protein